MSYRSLVFSSVLLSCSAAGLSAQAVVDQAPDRQPPAEAISLTDLAGLQPWDSGLRGFGNGYRALFTPDGFRFLPDLRNAETDRFLQLTPRSVMRGMQNVVEVVPVEPRRTGEELAVDYERGPGIREHYDVTPKHVELSWVFDERPLGSGDLVVRYAIDTVLPTPTPMEGGGLQFFEEGIGGVEISGVTGIDSNGDAVTGSIAYVDGDLELRLPARFVDEAAYPLVLDPAVGPTHRYIFLGHPKLQDLAYERGTDRFLFLFLIYTSPQSADLRGIYRKLNGSAGPLFTIASGNIHSARFAYSAGTDHFGITWLRESVGSGHSIEFSVMASGSQTVSQTVPVAFSPTRTFSAPDIGCDTNAVAGSGRGFVLVYDHAAVGRIEARRAYMTSSGALVVSPPTTVLVDSTMLGIDYSQPRISTTAAHAGDLLCAARISTQFNTQGIVTRLLRSDSGVVGPGRAFQSIGVTAKDPAIDGYDGRWVLAWAEAANSSSSSEIQVRSLGFDGSSLTELHSNSFAGGDTAQPIVAYTPGRTWLSHWDLSTSGPQRVIAIDSRECVDCADRFTINGLPRALTTTMSGNFPAGESGYVAWTENDTIFVRQMQNYGPGSRYANLGGGCGAGGAGGTIELSHTPGIGSAGLQCSVDGLLPTALLTVFNLAPVQQPIVCGPCTWSPFVVTMQPPIVQGRAEVVFPLPCLTWLVGTQFEAQWTTFDPSQTACSTYPWLVLSDRLLLTLGN